MPDDVAAQLPVGEMVSADVPAPPKSPGLVGGIAAVAILAGIGIAAAVYFTTPGSPPPPAAESATKAPTTWPPLAVPGLNLLPADVNVVAAVQPRAAAAYAERSGRAPAELLRAAGVPDRVLATLSELGLSPERITSVVLGLRVLADSPIPQGVLSLTLAEPLAEVDEETMLKKLKAQRGAGGRYRVDLGGLPVEMAAVRPGQYLFATLPADLTAAQAVPAAERLPAGVKEGIGRLSPASVAWAATDRLDWATRPALQLLWAVRNMPEWPGRLAGVEAAVVGVGLEPDPKWTVAVRGGDPAKLAELLAGGPTLGPQGEWRQGERSLALPAAR